MRGLDLPDSVSSTSFPGVFPETALYCSACSIVSTKPLFPVSGESRYLSSRNLKKNFFLSTDLGVSTQKFELKPRTLAFKGSCRPSGFVGPPGGRCQSENIEYGFRRATYGCPVAGTTIGRFSRIGCSLIAATSASSFALARLLSLNSCSPVRTIQIEVGPICSRAWKC
ncbi:MAG: hypothetical protein Ct9H300mP14_04940 [Gammaproteobacteria bacterium]|nr:MAG: hypothetical protein Ct9H300mP14_04940 [Gammaproteobacteria bacterium]